VRPNLRPLLTSCSVCTDHNPGTTRTITRTTSKLSVRMIKSDDTSQTFPSVLSRGNTLVYESVDTIELHNKNQMLISSRRSSSYVANNNVHPQRIAGSALIGVDDNLGDERRQGHGRTDELGTRYLQTSTRIFRAFYRSFLLADEILMLCFASCIFIGTRKGYSVTKCDLFGRVYTTSMEPRSHRHGLNN